MHLSVLSRGKADKVDNYMAGAVFVGRKPLFDRSVFVVSFLLLLLSIVMIYTASIGVLATRADGDTFFFVRKQLMFILIGGILSVGVLTVPMQIWAKLSKRYLIWFALALLSVTYFLGPEINGARRWINLGFVNFQSTELLKLVWILYISGYFYRHIKKTGSIASFIRPLIFLITILALIYLQKDFGSVVVVFFITAVLFFVSGLSIYVCLCLLAFLGVPIFLFFIMSSPYRVQRILSFLDPWQDEFGDSYQIVASFMAIGRGGFHGQGLGESLFKLAYLPEAHTDFILSIWTEETGFIGGALILILEFFLVTKMALTGFRHLKHSKILTGEISLGISMWFLAQIFINVGSISGLTPPKGLTLPLLSYGGSSLVMMMVAVALYLRITYEERYGLYKEYQAELKAVRRMERRQALKQAAEAEDKERKLKEAEQEKANEEAQHTVFARTVVFKTKPTPRKEEGQKKIDVKLEDLHDTELVEKPQDSSVKSESITVNKD